MSSYISFSLKRKVQLAGVWVVNAAVIDLFCGIGGLTKGLELAGLNVVAGIDIDESCRFAYEKNNHAQFVACDINVVSSDVLQEFYPNDALRILVGCAPCQPFSKYTQRYRKDGRKDDKWRLLYTFSDLIEEIFPSVVSMENVPELVNEHIFKDFVVRLRNLGYHCSWSIAYCPDYGVPQRRKRLVLLASVLGEITLIPPLFHEASYKTVRDAIGHLPQLRDGEVSEKDAMHCCTKMTDINSVNLFQEGHGKIGRKICS